MNDIFQGTNIILDLQEHYKTLSNFATGADEVLIASYGLYAGILHDGRDTTEWGYKYSNATHEFLDGLKDTPNVKILIGLSPLTYCDVDKRCSDCETKYISQLERLLHTAEHWPKFSWAFTEELHMKFFGMFTAGAPIGGLIGSRNLSDSTWFDVSFKLAGDELLKLRTYYLEVFSGCRPVTHEEIEKVENKILGPG